MSRFDRPAWRLVGSALSWALFAFLFTGLFLAAGVVMGLGGFCASGGPFVIETECPDSVLLFAPFSLPGMFVAGGISVALARGFGVSLIAWAWPILFVGLGIQFLLTAAAGIGVVSNVLVGVLFVVMGLAPVVFVVFSRTVAPTLVGSWRLSGERFVYDGTPRRYLGLTPTDEAVVPTARDWALSLGLWVVTAGGGAWLALTAFRAVAAAG